jgi:hypothetical protein
MRLPGQRSRIWPTRLCDGLKHPSRIVGVGQQQPRQQRLAAAEDLQRPVASSDRNESRYSSTNNRSNASRPVEIWWYRGSLRCGQSSSRFGVLLPASGSSSFPTRTYEHQVGAHLVVVDVLVAERQPEDPLRQQTAHRLFDAAGLPDIGAAPCQPVNQAHRFVGLPQQQRPAIGSDPIAVEGRHHPATFDN